MNIEIDDNLLKEIMTEYAAKKIVDDYFSCKDLPYTSYEQREAQMAKRIKDHIDKADWDKAPEKMNRLVVQEFFKKIIDKMS